MNILDSETDITSDVDFEMRLIDIPMRLIKENIRQQIIDPTIDRINYVEIVTDKIDMLYDHYDNNSDFKDKIDQLSDDFFIFIIEEASRALNLGVNLKHDYNNVEENKEVGLAIYRYLIRRYKKNIYYFFINYIKANRKELAGSFNHLSKKRDVTTAKIKKMKKNKEDVIILSNVPIIVESIMDMANEIDVNDFLEYSGGNNFNAHYLMDLFDEDVLVGSFIPAYFNRDVYGSIIDSVKSDIYYRLING